MAHTCEGDNTKIKQTMQFIFYVLILINTAYLLSGKNTQQCFFGILTPNPPASEEV